MTTAERITAALLLGVLCGAIGAVASLAVGTVHVWPGAIVAGAVNALLALAVLPRRS
ncbi:hypothetical protein [Lysinibacillus fusiformis]|uniref:hypothetical protein n=1 Tax=Lysinibacillus fusiformis TaxID=28031 RepID=UPI003D0794FB